ncbi:membrane protein insertase YidC [Acidicapsa dinghuensis]|uniref:Membrane protein insertase YidC n=1 Tax=Acidicapsa dinghuensis TaxID=2218256 RepID=A0ABW1EAY8_9BACT|nr:membrane protein insertase YidC [Acidicapsa dinghuensis]
MAEIRNPNASTQGPGGGSGPGGDMRSTLVFLLLAVVALIAVQYFKPPATQNQPQPQTQTAQQQQPAQTAASSPSTSTASTSSTSTAAAKTAAASSKAAVVATTETETVVENELYRITFTNRGAQVKSWILKRYKDSKGRPLDLVNHLAAASFGYPLSLYTYEQPLTTELNSALYQASATGTISAPSGIVFKYAKGPLTVTKTFTFNQSYVIGIKVDVKRDGASVRALISWPAGMGDQEEATQYASSKFAWSIDGKRDSTGANHSWFSKGVSGGATYDGSYDYAAAIDLYFAAAFMPNAPTQTTVVTLHNQVQAPKDATNPNGDKFPSPVLGVAVGDTSGVINTRLFAGPLQFDTLADTHTMAANGTTTGEDLKPLIQFGYLKIIAEPLFLLLRFVKGFVGNWGWAIIIVTLVFNLLMLPTRVMMMKSSLKMQRIQPKMDAIKRKYANLKATDPKRAEMQSEQMKLYKEEGINMYGNCLPMLVQIPLFYGYYRVLLNVIELRQASWGWLPNLAVADPLHILPIVIIASMFLVQIMTPSPGMDPQQRRMMAFMMPAIFGFSMWNFSSGLALYWATGNLLNLGLQYGINNSSMGKELQALAAKRAAKKADKTIQAKR